ncbi:MAG: permease [Chloroflexi bacterium]|nr:permease [Chloroflexota bacterium]
MEEREKRWDVLGIGSATVDDLLFVPSFPVPDTKNRLDRVERYGGGLVATALVAVARMGLRAAYAGMLGDDDISRWIADDLAREGVDVSPVVQRPDARPIHAFIMVESASQTRTILYTVEGRTGADDELPDAETIRAAKVLLIDDVGTDAAMRPARIAREAGIPVVADFEWTDDRNLISLPDHLIVSQRFAARVTGRATPAQAARALWNDDRTVVAITCGAEGCWSLTANDATPIHYPAFPVEVVDTTGCGDVFHGAYAAALALGLELEDRLHVAVAAAAIKATQAGGRKGIPTRERIETFLRAMTSHG